MERKTKKPTVRSRKKNNATRPADDLNDEMRNACRKRKCVVRGTSALQRRDREVGKDKRR